jgi:hypothetical protein
VNRRKFLQLAGLTGGGLVASATMAEAGAFAEITSWLKRRPVWSIPKNVAIKTAVIQQYSYNRSFSDLSLEAAIDPVVEQCAKELAYRAAYDIRIHTIPYDDMLPELARRGWTTRSRWDGTNIPRNCVSPWEEIAASDARAELASFYSGFTKPQRKIDHCDEQRLCYTKDENGKTVRAVYNTETRKIDLLPTTSLAFNT